MNIFIHIAHTDTTTPHNTDFSPNSIPTVQPPPTSAFETGAIEDHQNFDASSHPTLKDNVSFTPSSKRPKLPLTPPRSDQEVIDTEHYLNLSAEVTFKDIVASTPLPRNKRCNTSHSTTRSAPSFSFSPISEPLDLVLSKKEKYSPESSSSAKVLRISKYDPTGIESDSMIEDEDKDPDWLPAHDLDESDDDGNAELLNELTIFECVEKYQTIDSESDNDSDDELCTKSSHKQDDNRPGTSVPVHISTGKY